MTFATSSPPASDFAAVEEVLDDLIRGTVWVDAVRQLARPVRSTNPCPCHDRGSIRTKPIGVLVSLVPERADEMDVGEAICGNLPSCELWHDRWVGQVEPGTHLQHRSLIEKSAAGNRHITRLLR
jgi:hypothetical protein